jgi:type IV pilus assembly protein PilA
VGSIGTKRRRLERDLRSDGGFTLVELLVVMLVMGILLAIVIPMFLKAQNGSKDAAAKSHASLAEKTQKLLLLNDGSYAADATRLREVEPSLEYRSVATEAEASVLGAVYIREANGTTVELATRSATGECFWTRIVDGVTQRARGTCAADEFGTLDWDAGW